MDDQSRLAPNVVLRARHRWPWQGWPHACGHRVQAVACRRHRARSDRGRQSRRGHSGGPVPDGRKLVTGATSPPRSAVAAGGALGRASMVHVADVFQIAGAHGWWRGQLEFDALRRHADSLGLIEAPNRHGAKGPDLLRPDPPGRRAPQIPERPLWPQRTAFTHRRRASPPAAPLRRAVGHRTVCDRHAAMTTPRHAGLERPAAACPVHGQQRTHPISQHSAQQPPSSIRPRLHDRRRRARATPSGSARRRARRGHRAPLDRP